MQLIQSQLSAAAGERDRIESEVWATAIDLPYPGRRELVLPYLPALQELMTAKTLARWRAINVAIDEMAKHLP